MAHRETGLALVLTAVLFLTTAQLLIKARLSQHGVIPIAFDKTPQYLLALALDWQVVLGIAGLVVSSLLWYAAISRLPLSLAYPFAALSYPLVFAGSLLFLREPFSWQVLIGNGLIVLGVLLVYLFGYAARVMLIVRKDPRSTATATLYLISAAFGAAATLIQVITAEVGIDITLPVWLCACLGAIGFSYGSARSWNAKVAWFRSSNVAPPPRSDC